MIITVRSPHHDTPVPSRSGCSKSIAVLPLRRYPVIQFDFRGLLPTELMPLDSGFALLYESVVIAAEPGLVYGLITHFGKPRGPTYHSGSTLLRLTVEII